MYGGGEGRVNPQVVALERRRVVQQLFAHANEAEIVGAGHSGVSEESTATQGGGGQPLRKQRLETRA